MFKTRISRLAALACASVVLIASLALCACDNGQSQNPSGDPDSTESQLLPITIGTLATEDILPMWVAEADGLFKEAGLDVKIQVFQSATELIAGVSSKQVDLAMTDPMVSASIHVSGTPLRIQWVTLGTKASQGRFGIMTSDPSISSLKQLAGVPIGVGSNTILEYVMDVLMLNAGVPQEQIVKEELQKLPVRYEAMASGQVKAAALPASLLALGEAAGFIVVADDTAGVNISQSVMVVREEWLAQDGAEESIAALKEVWNDAAAAINAEPESYRSLLVSKANLSDAVAQTYPISEYPSCQLPTNSNIDPVLAWMKEKGYLSVELSYDSSDGSFSYTK